MLIGDYLVGEWRFSPASGELRPRSGDAEGARLEPKVAAVLGCLLERPGEVIAKEDLIRSVWPDTFVSDSAVFRHVSELRRALGDDARAPRYIETVPKRGYRLAAPVSRLPAPPATDRNIQGPRPTTVSRRVGPWVAGATVVGAMALAVVFLPQQRTAIPDPPARRVEPSGRTPVHSGDPIAYETLAFAELFEDRVDCGSYYKAIDLLEETLARDPGVLPAYSNIMDVSVATSVLGCTPTRSAMSRFEEVLDTARTRGLDAGRYHRAQGHLLLWSEWQPDQAEGEFARARELMPAGGRSDVGLAAALAAQGRLAEAISEAGNALREEPTHPGTNWALGMLLYFAGRSDEAVAQLRHTLELHPGFAPAQNLLALVYLRGGDAQAALHTVGTPAAATGDRFATVPTLVYAAVGDEEKARTVRRAWEQRARDSWVPATAMALMYEGLGERARALDWLRRGIEEGDAWSILLPVDPTFAELRDEATFKELLGRLSGTPGGS